MSCLQALKQKRTLQTRMCIHNEGNNFFEKHSLKNFNDGVQHCKQTDEGEVEAKSARHRSEEGGSIGPR